MKKLKLNTGYEIPILGLGTWKSSKNEVFEAIRTAVKIGYRHFDCAAIYGNEEEVGEALYAALKDRDVFRKELFITSKLWNDSHSVEDVEPALKKTLKDLKLDYLDLYLIHWPVASKKGSDEYVSLEKLPIKDTWIEMERLAGFGLAKSIGVSNFSISKIEDMKNYAGIMPAVNQIESHPFLTQEELLEYCQNNGIVMTAYAPLASRDRPDGMKSPDEPPLLQQSTILEIAEKYNATPAQILIAWQIERNVVVIPKSTNENRLKENYEAQYITLSDDDMKKIAELNRDYRYVTAKSFHSPENGYTEESIWA